MASLLGPSHAPLLSPATWLKEREDNTYGDLELLMFASINNDWFGHVKQIFNTQGAAWDVGMRDVGEIDEFGRLQVRADIVLNITEQGILDWEGNDSPMVCGMAALNHILWSLATLGLEVNLSVEINLDMKEQKLPPRTLELLCLAIHNNKVVFVDGGSVEVTQEMFNTWHSKSLVRHLELRKMEGMEEVDPDLMSNCFATLFSLKLNAATPVDLSPLINKLNFPGDGLDPKLRELELFGECSLHGAGGLEDAVLMNLSVFDIDKEMVTEEQMEALVGIRGLVDPRDGSYIYTNYAILKPDYWEELGGNLVSDSE